MKTLKNLIGIQIRKTNSIVICFLCLLFFTGGIGNLQAGTDSLEKKEIGEASQVTTVTGVVTDSNNEPLIGVSVAVKGTTTGTATGLDGDYSIPVTDSKAVLVFSFLGYQKKEITVGNQTTINVTLNEDSELLDEVVVVGFGTQKKANLTGAVSAVGADVFENRPVSNIGQALQGVVPNLNISISNGKPNTTPSFNIRGTSSIDYDANEKKYVSVNKSPLILVDGIEMGESALNQMNPNDIASMSVIKDASAAAIYGTKATFGVVLITTKTGSFNQKGRISYSYDISWDKPSALPDIMNAYEIQRFVMQNAEWTLGTVSDLDRRKMEAIEKFMADPTNPDNRYIMNGNTIIWTGNMNPYKEVVRDWTPTQKHNLNFSGGTDKMSYYFSLGYMNQEGMYKIGKDEFERFNFSTRVNAKVNNWFNIEGKINYNRNHYDEPYIPSYKGNIWSVLKQDADKNVMMPIKSLATDPAPSMWTDNYLAWLDYGNRAVSKNWTTVLAISPEFIIMPNTLKVRADISFTPQGHNYRRVSPKHEYLTFTWSPVSEVDESSKNTGVLRKSNTDNYQINVYADFNKTFKEKHAVAAVLGFNQENTEYSYQEITMNYLFSPNILNPNAVEDATLNTSSTSAYRRTGRAIFGRLNYIFDDKYLFEMNGRYDGSSRFTKDKRFFFFPSFSAGWRISEENFMDRTREWLDNLKIRGSWGKLGSQPGSNYPYQAQMTSTKAYYLLDGSWPNTVNAPTLLSPSLTWEKATTINLGLDINVLRNRLGLVFDVFQRTTSDILIESSVAYPNLLGAAPPRENSGEMRTRGWELTLTWNDRLSNGLSYSADFVLSDATSKVTKYPSNPTKALSNFYEGQKIGEIWGYETGGILQESDLELNSDGTKYHFWGPYHTGDLYPGDPWYRDLNGDGLISAGSSTVDDPGDRRIIGNNTPRFNFGLNLNASWKGFDVSLLFQGVAKRDVYITSTSYWGGGTNNAGSKWMYERSWKPDQTDAKFPRYRSTAGAPAAQTGFLESGAYLRMKQALIGYTLPAQLTRKLSIDKLRFTLSGYNLFEITRIPSILDPDQLSDAYPQKRTIALGAQITF